MRKNKTVILPFDSSRSPNKKPTAGGKSLVFFTVEFPVLRREFRRSRDGEEKRRRVDLPLTGKLLRLRLRRAGISVREVQKELGFENSQSIYRWLSGQAVPSVDNLYILHTMLGCHMEKLLVSEDRPQELRCAAYLLACAAAAK